MYKPVTVVSNGSALAQQLRRAFSTQESIASVAIPALVGATWAPVEREFHAEVACRFLPNNMLFRWDLGAVVQRWRAGSNSAHVHVGFILAGAVEISTASATQLFHAGDTYVFPRDEWAKTRVTERVSIMHVASSVQRLKELGISAESGRQLARGRASGLERALQAVADAALADGRPTELADKVTDSVLNELVVGVLIEMASGHQVVQAKGKLYSRALTLIERVHSDPSVHPADIAEGLNVSLRQLQRAFLAEGELSIAAALRRQRAVAAIRLLAAPGNEHRLVEDIALVAGFQSAYSLRSALAEHASATPTSLRSPRGSKDG